MKNIDRVDPEVRSMISSLIEDADINQAQIAKYIGVSRGRVNQVINKTNPSDLKSGSKEKLREFYDEVFRYESERA